MRAPRLAAAAAIACVLLPLTACGPGDSPTACVPELTVTPDDPRPGRIVTVATIDPCPVDLPDGARWEIRIQPADARIPIARAFVRPETDGSFEVSITVPPTIGAGPAIAHIANYGEFSPCGEGASCAAAEVTFEVMP